MSYKNLIPQSLAGIDLSGISKEELQSLFLRILNAGIHGIAFSTYLENQGPGDQITEQQIWSRMEIIKPYVKWVRSFSCIDGNEFIPSIAHENGLKSLVGAWIGTDSEKNKLEIDGLINLAQAGHADIVAVGNEVMLRGDLSEDELVDFILHVKKELPGIPVGYVDAYYEFAVHPRVTEVCDIVLANCYPFWEGYAIEHSLLYMKEMYRIAVRAANGKKVIISETGWPNLGSPFKGAVPSYENAIKYFIDAYRWALEDEIDIFYFSSFDEIWKIADEGDVGAYWGLWDKDGNLKYS